MNLTETRLANKKTILNVNANSTHNFLVNAIHVLNQGFMGPSLCKYALGPLGCFINIKTAQKPWGLRLPSSLLLFRRQLLGFIRIFSFTHVFAPFLNMNYSILFKFKYKAKSFLPIQILSGRKVSMPPLFTPLPCTLGQTFQVGGGQKVPWGGVLFLVIGWEG